MLHAATERRDNVECKVMGALGTLLNEKGDDDSRCRCWRSAWQNLTIVKEYPDTLVLINNLALLFHSKGEYRRALSLYEECVAKRKRTPGDDHLST
jgi:hypothetical protein